MDAQLTDAEQARAWRGPASATWVDNTERRDRMLAPYLAAVVDAAELSATDRVLDVGCGTGALTRTTARLAADGQATGIDVSDRMVAAARDITDAEGPINADFLEADAQTYAFPAGGFDKLVSRFGTMFFDDPVAAFANLHGALRPGGRLAFACWQSLAANDWFRVPIEAAAADLGAPGAAVTAGPGFSLAEPDRVRRVLGDAGFQDVELAAVDTPMQLGSVDDTLTFVSGTGTAQRLLAGHEPAAVERALDAMRAALEPHAEAAGVRLTGRAWLVTAHA